LQRTTSLPDIPQTLCRDIPVEVDVSTAVIALCKSAITSPGNCSFNCRCIFDTLADTLKRLSVSVMTNGRKDGVDVYTVQVVLLISQ